MSDITSRLADTGITFGAQGVPWRVGTQPHGLAPTELADYEAAGNASYAFLQVVHRALLAQDALGQALTNELQLGPVPQTRAGEGSLYLLRPDMFRDAEGRLTLVEMETMVGGLGMSEALRYAYQTASFPGTAASYSALLRQTLGLGDGLVELAIVNPESKAAYDGEFWVFATCLARYDVRVRVVRPSGVRVDGSVVYADGEPVNALHRFFRASEMTDVERAVLLAASRCVPTIQPWIEALDQKGLLAYIHDPRFFSYWEGCAEVDVHRLRTLVPDTFLVAPHNAERVLAIRNTSATNRRWWLKKSGNAWGARFALCGSDTGTGKWQQAIDAALQDEQAGHPWVLQADRVPRSLEFEYLLDGATRRELLGTRKTPIFMRGAGRLVLADMLVTARRSRKVHGASDAVMVPVVLS